MQGPLVAPDVRDIAEIVADKPGETFDQQVDPTLHIAGWIFVVKVSVTDENVVLMGHQVFLGTSTGQQRAAFSRKVTTELLYTLQTVILSTNTARSGALSSTLRISAFLCVRRLLLLTIHLPQRRRGTRR